MRVLHVLPTRNIRYGGPVAVAEELAAELVAQGIEAQIFPGKSGSSVDRWGFRTNWKRLATAVLDSDMLHIHSLWNLSATVSARIAQRNGIPYVLTPHGMLDKWAVSQGKVRKAIFGSLFERRNLLMASGVHFFNMEEMEEAKDYGVRMRSFVLPNGVSPTKFEKLPPKTAFLKRYPHLVDKVLVLFLGRMHPKKGFDLLIPALARASAHIKNIHLVIAGPDEGDYHKELVALIEKNGVKSRATFTGLVTGDAKLEVLGAADYLVLPSHQEGDSLAVKEAMASGLPVIVTPACHFHELTKENAGLIVSPDIPALTMALVQLATNPGMRTEMGNRARKLAVERYSWKSVTGRLSCVYKDIMSGGSMSPDWNSRVGR